MTITEPPVARYCVDRLLQRALGDELDDRVDGEHDVVAVARTVRAVAADEVHRRAARRGAA